MGKAYLQWYGRLGKGNYSRKLSKMAVEHEGSCQKPEPLLVVCKELFQSDMSILQWYGRQLASPLAWRRWVPHEVEGASELAIAGPLIPWICPTILTNTNFTKMLSMLDHTNICSKFWRFFKVLPIFQDFSGSLEINYKQFSISALLS